MTEDYGVPSRLSWPRRYPMVPSERFADSQAMPIADAQAPTNADPSGGLDAMGMNLDKVGALMAAGEGGDAGGGGGGSVKEAQPGPNTQRAKSFRVRLPDIGA